MALSITKCQLKGPVAVAPGILAYQLAGAKSTYAPLNPSMQAGSNCAHPAEFVPYHRFSSSDARYRGGAQQLTDRERCNNRHFESEDNDRRRENAGMASAKTSRINRHRVACKRNEAEDADQAEVQAQ
jgi:hypothetical protein